MLHRRLIRLAAASLAALALLAPTASARSDYPVGSPSFRAAADVAAADGVHVPGPTVVVEADESSGIDLGSAAIGAGVACGIVLLMGAAASTTVRHRRSAVR